MSKRLEVHTAIVALVKAAWPQCDVIGLDDDAERPRRIGPHGMIAVRDGEPGDPEIDLSPPVYHYTHRFPVEVSAYLSSEPLRTVLDRMAAQVGLAVAGDRTLGGLCDWLDVTALDMVDLIGPASPGSATLKCGIFAIVADYSTINPLN